MTTRAPRQQGPTDWATLREPVVEQGRRHVSEHQWMHGWSVLQYTGCAPLARTARFMLSGKHRIEKVLATLAAETFSDQVEELAHGVVVGVTRMAASKVVAAARALQLIGFASCAAQGWEWDRCACAVDIVKHEAMPMVRRLVKSADVDWTELTALVPD